MFLKSTSSPLVQVEVCQGTRLAPWLFLVMINDLSVPDNPRKNIWKFADDPTISEVIHTTENTSNLQDVSYSRGWEFDHFALI